MINQHIMEDFGIKYALELTGIGGLFAGIADLIGAIIAFVYGILWEKAEEIIEPYCIVFIVGAGCSILAFLLQWLEPSEKFNFGNIEELVGNNINYENSKEDILIRVSNATTDSNFN